MLPPVLANVKETCLFWLDAHYSGGITFKGSIETPISKELNLILSHPEEHIILIDDARNFVGKEGWPSLELLRDIVNRRRTGWVFEVRDDIIRIHKSHQRRSPND